MNTQIKAGVIVSCIFGTICAVLFVLHVFLQSNSFLHVFFLNSAAFLALTSGTGLLYAFFYFVRISFWMRASKNKLNHDHKDIDVRKDIPALHNLVGRVMYLGIFFAPVAALAIMSIGCDKDHTCGVGAWMYLLFVIFPAPIYILLILILKHLVKKYEENRVVPDKFVEK